MKIEEVLEYKLKKILKDKYSDTSVTQDDKKFILAQAKAKIQAYCHRLDIPYQAYYVWADMAIDILRGIDPALFETEETQEELNGRVSSIKTGDTTVNLNARSNSDQAKPGNDGSGTEDQLLMSYSNQLQAFRKFPNGCGCGLNGI